MAAMILNIINLLFLLIPSVISAEVRSYPLPPEPAENHEHKTFSSYYAKKIVECFNYNRIQRVVGRNINTVLYYNSTNDPVITVEDWIDKIDADNLLILTKCVKNISPDNFRPRPFDTKGYGGGNDVTFLNEILPMAYPELLDQVLSVAGAITDTLGWRPHPNHLGIRCFEVLEYGQGGELLFHFDSESIYTLSVMISNPETDFQGGSFIISNEKRGSAHPRDKLNVTYANPKQYGGVLFDSNMAHGITPLVKGSRTVFVLELWPYEDSDFSEQRPPGELKYHLPKVPLLLRVPILSEPVAVEKEKEVLSMKFDLRDAIMLAVGMLFGLLLALVLVEMEDWMTAAKQVPMRMKKAPSVANSVEATSTGGTTTSPATATSTGSKSSTAPVTGQPSSSKKSYSDKKNK